jgi:hypothetical protein
MDGTGVLRPLGAQHLRRLAGERRKLHIARHIVGNQPGERRFAGSGIAEQPENGAIRRAKPGANALMALSCWGERFMALV